MNEHSYEPSNFQSLDSAPQHRIKSQMSKCLDVCAQEHQSLALWPQKWWHPSKGLQASVPSVSSWLLHISSAPIKQWVRIKRHEAEFVSLFMLKVEAKLKSTAGLSPEEAAWNSKATGFPSKPKSCAWALGSVDTNAIHTSLISHGNL